MADGRTKQEKLYARWQSLKEERQSWVDHWSEISDYLLPRSGRFFVQDRNDGRKRNNQIYDSTGTRALRVLAAGLMGGATSPARPWFRLATTDPDMMQYAPVKLWLSDVTRIMLDIFQRSNTYRTLHMLYEELGAFGTGASIVMDDFDKVIHQYPLTAGEFCIAKDYKGDINTLAREFDTTVEAAVGEFGYKNCSIRTQQLYDQGNYDKWITVIHLIEPRKDRDPNLRDNLNMPYKSCYFELGGDQGKMLRESGFKQFRALVPRWSVTGGDIYGHSCGMEALGDVKQLQHEQLRKAEGIDYQTKPPLGLPTSAKNRETDTFPGGISYFDTTGGGSASRSLFESNLRLDHLLEDIRDVRERINSTFYTDLFLMLANDTRSGITATEVAERHEEKLLMLGPVLERLHNELLDPLVSMTFQRMLEVRGSNGEGLVPPPPQELQGQDLNVEFVSMLAQAQRAVSTNSIDRFVNNLGAVATAKPGVLDKFNEDEWVDHYSDMLGVPPELINSDEQVALIRKERAKQQQAAQQAALMEQGANIANKLGNTPTDTKSALTDATRAFSGYT